MFLLDGVIKYLHARPKQRDRLGFICYGNQRIDKLVVHDIAINVKARFLEDLFWNKGFWFWSIFFCLARGYHLNLYGSPWVLLYSKHLSSHILHLATSPPSLFKWDWTRCNTTMSSRFSLGLTSTLDPTFCLAESRASCAREHKWGV